MLRTLIVLPDGTEISSGVGTKNAIQSITITECVNGAQELTLGSCCSNMIEAQLLTIGGGVSINAGDEITVYREADDGTRFKVGLFTTEKPTRPSANTLKLTAYDRVSWLDLDLTQWVASLQGWPYELYDLATMVCEECGLYLKNEDIPNGEYSVKAFSGEGITGRQLMQWIGQVAGRFCRATADGEIEFAWYEPLTTHAIGVRPISGSADIRYENGNLIISAVDLNVEDDGQGNVTLSGGVEVSDDGEGNVVLTISNKTETIMYYQNGLSFEDYTVAAIEKVQLRQNEEDVGTVYPDGIEGAANTYIINGNPLLTASSGDDLATVAEALYEHLKNISYTPCKVSIPASMTIRAGHVVKITDRNGRELTAYVMTKKQSGQRDAIECTGSPSRDSSTVINNQSLQALNGKVLNLRQDVDGLKVENSDSKGKIAALALDVEGIKGTVSQQEGLSQRLTTLEQSAQGLRLSVESIQTQGATKLKTAMGYTFDDEGLSIARSGEPMENRLDNTGMQVLRSGTPILQADHRGVNATDVTVRNYLILGDHARIENYAGSRTACFYLEG